MVVFFSARRAKPLLLVLMVPGSAASQKGFSKRSGGQAVGVFSRTAESIPGVGNKASIHAKSVLLRAEPKPAPKASKGCPVTHERSPPLIWEDSTSLAGKELSGRCTGGSDTQHLPRHPQHGPHGAVAGMGFEAALSRGMLCSTLLALPESPGMGSRYRCLILR